MTVRAILEQKGTSVVALMANEPVSAAVEQLASKRIGAVVIVDADRRVEGILSERDVVREIAGGGTGMLEQPISSMMTKKVVTCHPTHTIGELMGLMTGGKFRHLPVVDEGRLAGIVSIGDVVKARIEEAEQEAAAMRDYIATG